MKKSLSNPRSAAAALLGSARSARKAQSSRKNGLLGGRPRGPLYPFWEYRRNLRNSGRPYTISKCDRIRSHLQDCVGFSKFEAEVSRLPAWLRRAIVRNSDLL